MSKKTEEAKAADNKQPETGAETKPPETKPPETGAAEEKPAGPWIYVGPTDYRRQLKHKTAYLRIPAGMDEKEFVTLAEYPAWAKKKE